jgi:mitogen-activated protein kinase kinase
MELDILHRAVAPEIVEFYGAFFIESCVYYCMEYMDAGSLDKLQGAGVPESVLARIAHSMTGGLRFLKENLNIIHRGWYLSFSNFCDDSISFIDVKPTNILANRRGQIKLCDFGVSGELNKSLARTNIGCQSYMAVRIFISSVFSSDLLFSRSVSKENLAANQKHTPLPLTFGL